LEKVAVFTGIRSLDTSLVVTTTMRVYHMRLKSSRTKFMPYVSFTYPDQMQAVWEAEQQSAIQERQRGTMPTTGEYFGNLRFDYSVDGSAAWKPTRVFNDGKKTIIECHQP
jgi:type IV secretion system protein TrbG